VKTIDLPVTDDGYAMFLRCKRLPAYRIVRDEDSGRAWCETDDASYAAVFGNSSDADRAKAMAEGVTTSHLMDFQTFQLHRSLELRRSAVWWDCGLGKTPLELAWAHAVAKHGRVLWLCPLSVLEQTQRECERFHGHRLVNLRKGEPWSDGIGILNFEARREVDMRGVLGIVLDESGILKASDGQTRDYLCGIAANCEYRLAASATPAPNDQAEYANHAVFLGLVRTAKEFWSRFFRKEGTENILRGHAVEPFYRYLASWATYIQSPRALGFDQTTELADPPQYIESCVPVHEGWRGKTERLFQGADAASDRPLVFGEIRDTLNSPRMKAIAEFADKAVRRGVIAWALRNEEEKALAKVLGESGEVRVVNGAMPVEERVEVVDAYRAGQIRHLVSKAKVLGFGVNLPECDRMVYSGYDYSFESFYQAVRRAHRYGRKGRLKVFMPYTAPELPILSSLKQKMATFEKDVMELQGRFWDGVKR
jgi:superfamily II DNA or RNA helicase